MKTGVIKVTTLLFAALVCNGGFTDAFAQTYDCNYKAPVVAVDFGTVDLVKDYSFSGVKNYKRANSGCPNDGEYSFVSYTSDCFGGRWHSVLSDHTTGDVNGRMMVVNASERPGYFFSLAITGLKPGATYQLSAWLMNICIYGSGCYPTPPEIEMGVIANGHLIASFQTGKIVQTNVPSWKKYYGEFTMPPATDLITLQMKDLTAGGCGNDFALDDIFISECVLVPPVVTPAERPKPEVAMPKPVEAVIPSPQKTAGNTKPQEPVVQLPSKKPATVPVIIQRNTVPIPQVIATRANPVVKQITTDATEMVIELYDNGEIDGDTVSIFHNNQLIVNHAGISAKPVTIKIKVDPLHPHHELVMVADNLGSIPPNTSLMIITAGKKRYEIFISSSEQKNAKVVIDLQE